MMRLARYTRDPITNVTARVLVRVGRVPARQAPELRLVSISIPGPATRTCEGSIGRVTEPNRHPYHGSQQENALCQESRAPLLPPWETVRILKRNASVRLMSTAHQLPRVFGLRLSLRTHFVRPISPLLLVQAAPVTLCFQYRSQVRSLVAVRTGDGTTHADITADPFRNGLFIRQGHLDPNPTVPFPVLPEDFTLLTQCRPREGKRAVNSPMLLGGNVELADSLNHDPQVKAGRFARSLHLCRVNQFSAKSRNHERLLQRAGGLQATAIVGECTSGGTSGKFASSLTRGDTGHLHCRNRMCGKRVQRTEVPRQERQRIGLVARGKQFQLIRESYLACHTGTLSTSAGKTRTLPKSKVSLAPVNGRTNGPLRLRLSESLRLGDLRKSGASSRANPISKETL